MSGAAKKLDDRETVVAYELNGNCYLNVTARCTLRCAFCPKFNGTWEVRGYDLTVFREPSVEEMLAEVAAMDCAGEVVFCGLGEPTLRLSAIVEVGQALRKQGVTVRLNTDGLASLVHGRDVAPELATAVDKISISLNAQDQATYEKHTRPPLEGAYPALLDFARQARAAGMEVTLTALEGLPGVEIDACQKIAESLGVRFRRRVYNEVG